MKTYDQFDIIKDMLACLSRTMEEIPCSTPILHNAVYLLSLEEKFSQLLKGYNFEFRGYYYFSDKLYSDLVNLESCGFLSVDLLSRTYILRKNL